MDNKVKPGEYSKFIHDRPEPSSESPGVRGISKMDEMYKLEANREFPAESMKHALRQLGDYFTAASFNPKLVTNQDGLFDVGCVKVGRVEDFQDGKIVEITDTDIEDAIALGVIDDVPESVKKDGSEDCIHDWMDRAWVCRKCGRIRIR